MFERYTETARRAIFFARYEASQFGSPYIEAEHLLLGVLREDKTLAIQLLGSYARLEELRNAITSRGHTGQKIATSVDLPLNHEAKRALAYASEESERLTHKHIGAAHLLLGLLREEKSIAAQLLRERGVTVESVREQVSQSGHPVAQGRSASIAGLSQWVSEREASGLWAVENRRIGNKTHFALYSVDKPGETGDDEEVSPEEKLARIQTRIHFIVRQMEHAIANHEFEKARSLSDEERKERDNQRRLCEEFHPEAPPPRVPLLCIAVIGNDLFAELILRCDAYMAEGVPEVWLLDPASKRAYTVTKADGFREFQGETLRIANPPLEMNPARIFDPMVSGPAA